MRNLSIILSLSLITSVFTACKTNNDVVSNGLLQKRKHTNGFHWAGIHKEGRKSHPVAIHTNNDQRNLVRNASADQMKNFAVVPATEVGFTQAKPATENLLFAAHQVAKDEGFDNQTFFIEAHVDQLQQTELKNIPALLAKPEFKKKSAIKKRSGWALFLSLTGSILFSVLAVNAFLAFLPGGVLALTIAQLALLLGGLLLSWKYKDTNGASKAAFVLSWIFLGLTALLYFSLIVLGML